jgi:septal ring factor EnvC (AmiA/AmiB activator)
VAHLGVDGPRPLLASARATLAARPAAAAATPRPVAFGGATSERAPPALGSFLAPIAGRPVAPATTAAAGGDGTLFRGGLLLETAVAQPVSAPSSGTVAFAAPFKGFGLLLIIDRGDGYHILLSGFSRLDVGRGARVTVGQAVGTIGDGGGAARLYVELRRHGSPVDPSAWQALREDKVRS